MGKQPMMGSHSSVMLSRLMQGCSHQLSGGVVDTITRGVAREVRRTRRVEGMSPRKILHMAMATR